MKIVGIVGIIDLGLRGNRLWCNMRDALAREFPNTEFALERRFYLPWQAQKMRAFADSIVAKHDTGEELILLGYSLGGIIACAIAPRFVRSNVRLIATVGTPHQLAFLRRMLAPTGAPYATPDITFSGVLDPVVLWFLTDVPGSKRVSLLSDHLLCFLLSSRPAAAVARGMRSFLEAK